MNRKEMRAQKKSKQWKFGFVVGLIFTGVAMSLAAFIYLGSISAEQTKEDEAEAQAMMLKHTSKEFQVNEEDIAIIGKDSRDNLSMGEPEQRRRDRKTFEEFRTYFYTVEIHGEEYRTIVEYRVFPESNKWGYYIIQLDGVEVDGMSHKDIGSETVSNQ